MQINPPAHVSTTRRSRKKSTVRLPLALAARLEALCEMHPETTRTQLIGDLLGLGLAEVERVRSGSNDPATSLVPDVNQPIYLLMGPFAEFHHLTYKHHLALEHALAKEAVQNPPPVDEYTLGDQE